MGIEDGSGTHIVKITRQGWEPLTKMVYGVKPDLTLTLQEASGKNVLLLPFGASDDGAHSSQTNDASVFIQIENQKSKEF